MSSTQVINSLLYFQQGREQAPANSVLFTVFCVFFAMYDVRGTMSTTYKRQFGSESGKMAQFKSDDRETSESEFVNYPTPQ